MLVSNILHNRPIPVLAGRRWDGDTDRGGVSHSQYPGLRAVQHNSQCVQKCLQVRGSQKVLNVLVSDVELGSGYCTLCRDIRI